MKKFEIGKQYVIGHVDFYGDVTVEVTARTAKFATFKKFGKEKRVKIQIWDNREVAIWGGCNNRRFRRSSRIKHIGRRRCRWPERMKNVIFY